MPMTLSTNPRADQLLAMARAGDIAALGTLLGLYGAYLAILARVQIGRRLQGKVDPADLVQETFLEAHRHFPRFRGTTEAEFVTWLRQILATNLAHVVRRYVSTQRRDLRLECQLQKELDQSSRVLHTGLMAKGSSPSQRLVRREQAVLLADALEQLPENYREVIVLRHLEGKTFPEIARCLDRTLDCVEKLWIRALDRLRRVLGGDQ